MDNLPLFLGWRIWKMRNKLLFENKRDHIVSVINSACLDQKMWMEAISTHNSKEDQAIQSSRPKSIQDVLLADTTDYCLVDASWISPTEMCGIGWSLFSKEGTLRIQGSSAVSPTNSPLIAETTTLLSAIQQLIRLSYKKVHLIGDCEILMKLAKNAVFKSR
ncbi:uncharacterized protein LOC108808815 [Raphanus sativus]|uniref:Uncharacterized protein LOC108808815 n=1 Tax=Raphanus sativus TaxID=3726 RepID=A0A6J0JN21_RAPSA|nr:uncharacterized protein LOC108808815 [Raphanus sativus]